MFVTRSCFELIHFFSIEKVGFLLIFTEVSTFYTDFNLSNNTTFLGMSQFSTYFLQSEYIFYSLEI